MNFTFAGVGVYLVGVKAPTSGIVSITIDNDPPQTRNISSGNATIFWFRQMLFGQDSLTPATHTVLVNQSSPTGSGHLSLDQIIITRDSDLTGPSSSTPAPPGSGTTKPSPNQPTASTSPGSEAGGSQSGKSGTNTGAIVGGVIAGVVALAAIGAAIFFWLRLRKAQSGERETPASEVRLAAYAPRPTGSYAHSIGATSYGGYDAGSSTIGTTAATTATAPTWTTPNAPFVEKPAFGPPPYAHS